MKSCGKCVPCRVGSLRLFELLERIDTGRGNPGDLDEALERIDYLTRNIDGRTFCPLGAALVNPARSTLAHFRAEYEFHLEHRVCWRGMA